MSIEVEGMRPTRKWVKARKEGTIRQEKLASRIKQAETSFREQAGAVLCF